MVITPPLPKPTAQPSFARQRQPFLHCLGREFDSDPHPPLPLLYTQTENLLGSYFPRKISELDAFLKVLGLGRE